MTWALGEMARTTQDPALAQRFAAALQGTALTAVTWQTPEILGVLAVALDSGADPGVRSQAVAAIDNLGQTLVATAAATGYGLATAPTQYQWESNEDVVHRAAALVFAFVVTGDDSYRRQALEQLDWLLGGNSLARSFVTGYGANPVVHPYHWTAYALGRAMPGWASGGPNQSTAGADLPLQALIFQQTPPAKSYLDMGNALGSYASNEGETSENAALAFVTGYFVPAATGGNSGESSVSVLGGGCEVGMSGPASLGLLGALAPAAILVRRRRKSRR